MKKKLKLKSWVVDTLLIASFMIALAIAIIVFTTELFRA